VDAVIAPTELRAELVRRFACYADRERSRPSKRNPVTPV
jgi:acetyl-CoA carboxylase carboxyltransferase component